MKRPLQNLLIVVLILLSGCQKTQIDTGISFKEVKEALEQFFAEKHPSYAELLQLQKKGLSRTEAESAKLLQLWKEVPVSGIVHSFPQGPVFSFEERTNFKIKKYRSITLNLFQNKAGTCSLKVIVKTRDKSPDISFADTPPISEEDLRKLLNLPS